MAKKITQKEAYESIISDANEIYDFVKDLSDDCNLDGANIPDSLKIYFDNYKTEESVKNKAATIAAIGAVLGGPFAAPLTGLALGSTVSLAGLSLGTTGSIAGLAAGGLFPPLIPVLIGGTTVAIVAKKILNKKDKKIAIETSDKLRIASNKLSEGLKNLYEKEQQKAIELKQWFEQTASKNAEKAKEHASHIAILLDDTTHNNVNKRIQQYQQIALDQNNRLRELEEQFSEFKNKYDSLLKEKEELQKKIEDLQRLLYGTESYLPYLT